jgi:type I restriction enzyme S subunit
MAGEWETVELGEVAAVRSGYAFKSSDWKDSGIPVVKIANVKGGRLEMSGCSFVDESIASEAGEFQLTTGDILVAMTGYIGDLARVRKTDLPCVLNQRVGKFSVRDAKRLDADFLYTFLAWAETRQTIEGLGYGSAQPNVSPSLIHKVEMPLPPLAEQKAIAAVLGSLDDKIELNRRMNATLEAMARALFQSWFVDFDPVRAKLDGRPPAALDPATAALFPASFQDSEAGHIPKGWTVGTLGDIGTNSRRGVQPSDIAPNTPYIALEHMPRRCIALGDWDDSADVASGKSAFKKGEILFGKLRPYFHKIGVAPFDGVCSTDILVLAPKCPEWFGFLLGHASSDELIQFTDLASTGTKMPRTNWSDVSSFKVALPPKPLAAAFTRNIQPMLDRIHANLHQSRTLATLRDTLLPKLLSGELSVEKMEALK